MKPDKCQSKEDGVCNLPIGTCTQCEQGENQDEIWEAIDEIKEDESPYFALKHIKENYLLTKKK